MEQNKRDFLPPAVLVSEIPPVGEITNSSSGWGMGEMLFDLNRWSFGESDIE